MDNLLFASLKLPSLDCKAVVDELKQLPESAWVYDSYRNIRALPLLTRGGQTAPQDFINLSQDQKFLWTPYTPQVLQNYFEEHIFPWMNPIPRIILLKTDPQTANHEHIDCTIGQFRTRQHKFRYVLQGNVEDLYFITKDKKIFVPQTDRPFIMDGAWPHGMVNNSDQPKFTVSAGAPWAGSDNYPSFDKTVAVPASEMPEDFEKYFGQS